jgi:hypothetical protein
MASVTEWSGASSAMHLLSILNDIMSVEPPESSSLESTASLALDIAPIIFSRHICFAVRTIGRGRIWFLRRLGVWGFLRFPVYRSGFTLAITLVLAALNARVCDPTPTFRRTFRSRILELETPAAIILPQRTLLACVSRIRSHTDKKRPPPYFRSVVSGCEQSSLLQLWNLVILNPNLRFARGELYPNTPFYSGKLGNYLDSVDDVPALDLAVAPHPVPKKKGLHVFPKGALPRNFVCGAIRIQKGCH